MPINRLYQFSAENRIISDLKGFGAGDLPTISSSPVNTGSYAYNPRSTQTLWGTQLPGIYTAVRASQWLYHSGFGNLMNIFTASVGTGTSTSRMRVGLNHTENEIFFARQSSTGLGTVLASISAPSSFTNTAVWIHLGFTYFAHEDNGFISLYINGERVLHYAGDTRMGEPDTYSTSIQHVFFMGQHSGTSAGFLGTRGIDDMFIDSYENEPDAAVPARRFLPAFPNGAGADAAWTPIGSATNWENVDENPHDADTTYNKAVASGLRDTYQFSNVTLPEDYRIVSVIAQPIVRRLDAELNQRISLHAFDGANYEDGDNLVLPMDYGQPVFQRFMRQPDNSPWIEDDFNSMQFGMRSFGDFAP